MMHVSKIFTAERYIIATANVADNVQFTQHNNQLSAVGLIQNVDN